MRVGVARASGPERLPLSSVTSPAAATATTTASTTPTAQPARRGGTRRRRVEIGSRRVGRATTATVVQVSVSVIVADFFLTKLFLLL